MQFHGDGFRPGDPDLKPKAAPKDGDVDVLIVGAGPAGLTLAAYLAGFPQIKTAIIERKSGPMEKGQADGVSCRSMEMFQTFGFAHKIMREAYWVNEATFWKPDPEDAGSIIRNGRVQDVEDGLSEMPHVILNQARVHDMYLDAMTKSPARLEPMYNRQFASLMADSGGVTVTVDHNGQSETLRARYVVGCDGAHSEVRKAIGQKLAGDSAHQAWGVMDILCNTDFPDIRFKSLIQSAQEGTVLVIPREGGYLVRLYVELSKLNPEERISDRDVTIDDLIAAASRIMAPYTLDVKEVAWWSVYEIGQRLTRCFDDRGNQDEPRVFIAGDACHTHSPKAGQGMNVSMGDAFNLGWKLVHVLTGLAEPDLLRTYSDERQAVAQALIDFDEEWAGIMSAPPEARDGDAAPLFQKYFIEHGRYTAGVSVCYDPSSLTGTRDFQHLATGFSIGTRFHSAPVVRLADGKPIQLGHVQNADARWLLLAFAPYANPTKALGRVSEALAPTLKGITTDDANIDAVVDTRAVLQQSHQAVGITDMPPLFFPRKGRFGLRDYEKVFCPDPASSDIFDLRGVDRGNGCLVLVRPDQYVANILPLNGFDALAAFLAGVIQKA